MSRRIYLFVFLSAVLLCGCTRSAQESESLTGGTEAKPLEMTEALQEIIDRGYLTVGCKDDVPGFGYYDEAQSNYTGREIEIAWHIAARLFGESPEEAKAQNRVHFIPVTVDTREKVLLEGTADYVIATYTITEERSGTLAFSDSYYTDAVGFMIQNVSRDKNSLSDPEMTSAADLDGKKIGVITGSTSRSEMLKFLEMNGLYITPYFIEYASYADLDKALDSGEIDVFCVDTCILNGYLTPQRSILPEQFAPQHYGIAAAKDKRGLIEAANAVLSCLSWEDLDDGL